MKFVFVVSVLACAAWQAVARSLRSNMAKALGPFQQDAMLNLHLTRCQADPKNCGTAVDFIATLSETVINKTDDSLINKKQEVQEAYDEFTRCHEASKTAQLPIHTKASKHKTCREQQAEKVKTHNLCTEARDSIAAAKKGYCEDKILNEKPQQKECQFLGQETLYTLQGHYEGMVGHFDTLLNDYEEMFALCANATTNLTAKIGECNVLDLEAKTLGAECDGMLMELQDEACTWSQERADRCAAYDDCYDKAVEHLQSLPNSTEALMETLKLEYRSGKTLACLGEAVDSDGKLNAEKVLNCKKTSFDTSHLSVPFDPTPEKLVCATSKVYPGSARYRKIVYTGLPKDIDERIPVPQPCVAWKGICSAKSTFFGAGVHLKRHDKLCGLNKHSVLQCDGTLVDTFTFRDQTADDNCGHATLAVVSKGSPAPVCSFDQFAKASTTNGEQIKCSGETGNVVTIKESPDPSGRDGTVVLQFPGPEQKFGEADVSQGGPHTGLRARIDRLVNRRYDHHCNNGAFFAIGYSYHPATQRGMFPKVLCRTFPHGVGHMQDQPEHKISLKDGGTLECGPQGIMAGLWHKNNAVFYKCRTLPPGMEIESVSDWSGWTGYQADGEGRIKTPDAFKNHFFATRHLKLWDQDTLECGSNQVIVSLKAQGIDAWKTVRWSKKCATISVRPTASMKFVVEYEGGLDDPDEIAMVQTPVR